MAVPPPELPVARPSEGASCDQHASGLAPRLSSVCKLDEISLTGPPLPPSEFAFRSPHGWARGMSPLLTEPWDSDRDEAVPGRASLPELQRPARGRHTRTPTPARHSPGRLRPRPRASAPYARFTAFDRKPGDLKARSPPSQAPSISSPSHPRWPPPSRPRNRLHSRPLSKMLT